MKLAIFRGLLVAGFISPVTLGCGTSHSKLADAPSLSITFGKTCANCHGAQGEGDFGPSLKQVDFATFSAKVRSGGRGMPKFSPDVYPDSALRADFTALTGKAAQ